jgi:hypothetical protein
VEEKILGDRKPSVGFDRVCGYGVIGVRAPLKMPYDPEEIKRMTRGEADGEDGRAAAVVETKNVMAVPSKIAPMGQMSLVDGQQ